MFSLVVLEAKVALTRQALYHLSHSTSPLALVIFEIGSCFMPRWAWTMILLCMLPQIARMTGPPCHWLRWGEGP
jgi:hypothetical protein